MHFSRQSGRQQALLDVFASRLFREGTARSKTGPSGWQGPARPRAVALLARLSLLRGAEVRPRSATPCASYLVQTACYQLVRDRGNRRSKLPFWLVSLGRMKKELM